MSTSASSVDTSPSSESVVSKWESRPMPIQTFEEHANSVTCVAFFKDEQRLVTGSHDDTVRVWNRETTAQTGDSDALERLTGTVYEVDVSGGGRTIASSSIDATVRITLIGHPPSKNSSSRWHSFSTSTESS
ncbi:hypothetical protein HYDPIDRAFT_112407 [Hydnomerulius pinastri MD-312]|uniref:Unplaced genomic scaffold scaffold_14, whole genome shotgun sequence n=1 Tax=Hydnomerulius pinastri MD-312 TaxID=994086 RepID=A0A0C9WF57_9AGAM|nr:hypothetical protein HYDPIDRAFT_112407 [Hydnomerulius pinastri MD-312]